MRVAVLLLAVLIAGCSGALHWDGGDTSAPARSAGTYTVKEGDTLFSIAFRHSLDHEELARWNDIDNPSLIYPGKELQLGPGRAERQQTASAPRRSAGASAATSGDDPGWEWPVTGEIIGRFGRDGNRGIDIAGQEGDRINAASDGRVVYSGSGLSGYGKLIIIKHNDTYLSAYAHNRELFVEEGDAVSTGQRIAEMGRANNRQPHLHFEIRVNGEPVDPLSRLPDL